MAAKGDPDPGPFRRPDAAADTAPVKRLGLTFDSEDARREHFLARLKEKLPGLRQRPYFPAIDD